MTRSPLRWPGGKHRARNQIQDALPKGHFAQYVEPFCGGLSVFLLARELEIADSYWINDGSASLVQFVHAAQDASMNPRMCAYLHHAIRVLDGDSDDARMFCDWLKTQAPRGPIAAAVQFFIRNRTSFAGIVTRAGFSPSAAVNRLTPRHVDRIRPLGEALDGVKITNIDVLELLPQIEDGSFVFLDPPYYAPAEHRMYGDVPFPHELFLEALRKEAARFRFLVTYDRAILDEPVLAGLLRDFAIEAWSLRYSMTSFKGKSTKMGEEIFVRNY